MNSEKEFLKIDLVFFSALAIISEIISQYFLGRWNSSFYYSFAIAIGLIAMLRWGAIGVVVAMAGGLPMLFFSDMDVWSGILFYIVAGLFAGIPIAVYGSRNRDIIISHPLYLMFYILLSHCSLSVGKGIAIFILTGETTGTVDFFSATLFILVINTILCLVLRMRQGLLCDMRYYFTDKEGEGNEERRG